MLSGDNLYTAIEAAKRAGILTEAEEKEDKSCMIGKRFRELVGSVKKVVDKNGVERLEISNKQNFKQIA